MTRLHRPVSIPKLLGSAAVPGYPLVLDTEGVVLLGSEQTVDWDEVLRWKGEWVNGNCYYPGDVVRDGDWLMVANTYTCEKPAPTAIGPAAWAVEEAVGTTPPWVTAQYTGNVFTGIDVTPPAGQLFQVQALRMWVQDNSPNANYRWILVDDADEIVGIGATFTGDILAAPGWVDVVGFDPTYVQEGDDFKFILQQWNAASSTQFNHPWVNAGTSNTLPPALGDWNYRVQQDTVRINKTDDDGTDRSAELANVIAGSTIRFAEEADLTSYYEYEVVLSVELTTSYEFSVVLTDTGIGGPPAVTARCQVYFTIPTPTPTTYVYITNGWSADPNLQGFIEFDTLMPDSIYRTKMVLAAINENIYGVDILAQPFSASDDWDIMATSADIAGATGSEINSDPFWNGTIRETFDARAASNGSQVTMTLEQTGGGDLTLRFSDGDTVLDTTPIISVSLTVGSNESPTPNYVYVPLSTKVVTVSTSGWPTEEHVKISYLLVPTAVFVQAHGAYVDQNWNDHLTGTNGQGHLSHITERSRRLGAQYFSGIAGNGVDDYLTITGTTIYFSSVAGVIYQMHKHTFPAADTGAGDIALVKNWDGDPYHELTNLYDIVADSTGTTIGPNRWFNLVVWGVANKSGEYEPLMINLPSGTYQSEAAAVADALGYDDFSIPREFDLDSSTGFLICRITVQKEVNTWEYGSTLDLRGSNPQTATGSGGAAGTLFSDNVFRVYNDLDNTQQLQFDLGSVTTGNTRVLTVPDKDGTIALLSDIAVLATRVQIIEDGLP